MKIIFMVLALSFGCVSLNAEESQIEFSRLKVFLYRESKQPSHVVLFISGDGGWNKGVVDMARSLAKLDAMVVGIDIIKYLNNLSSSKVSCLYPPQDFEALSKYVQQKLGYHSYHRPILVGYSSGATLVYTTLVQAPPGTFSGGVSLGFSPDLNLPKPLCEQGHLKTKTKDAKVYEFAPVQRLEEPWVVLNGEIDQVCAIKEIRRYVSHIGNAKLVSVPKVGHGFSVQKNWMPQLEEAFKTIIKEREKESASRIEGLPLIEKPAERNTAPYLALIISGDGGWAGLDRSLADVFSKKGIPVVGLNSLQYFWKKRSPDGAAQDLRRILEYYLAHWHKSKVIAVGYSFGADTLPFMISRLPHELKSEIALVALLGPSAYATFEFHLTDWFGIRNRDSLPTLPEVNSLAPTKVLCVYGKDEKETLCKMDLGRHVKVLAEKGGHHFSKNYEVLANEILAAVAD